MGIYLKYWIIVYITWVKRGEDYVYHTGDKDGGGRRLN